jgi:hypothetical protein
MAKAETETQLGDGAPLEIFYMKLNQDQVEARLGKMRRGQVVAVDRDMATRLALAGVADQVSKSDFDDRRERRQDKMSKRQAAMRSLNDQAAMWDVATYRDVLTASEKGLRTAFAAGMPLVNIHQLRDEDGDPLSPDADIEEILEARQWNHPDLVAPFAAHDRSSVMGGGSPYVQNTPSGPMPLNPTHRAIAEGLLQQDAMAQRRAQDVQESDDDPSAPRTSRQAAARGRTLHQRTLEGNQPGATAGPGISPQAADAAKAHDVPPPKQGNIQSNKD